ncbi:cytochrome P450 [Phlyctema vagabunda]|uniref:Cytochrome P450 n=1 Tax=Phlyctema vagabunda TaxID=108571 RepID=A0ABR4PX10_9HELO
MPTSEVPYSSITLTVASFGLYALYWSVLIVYRIYFSPLSHIPGPKLAAATQLYEFYFNVIKHGKFIFKVEELHRIYGPIVRINPFEVHIDDPEFHDTIYSSSEPRDKAQWHTQWQPQRLSGQATADHDQHRPRRAALNPFFSKRQIQKFAPFIQSRMDLCCHQLQKTFEGTDKVISIGDVFSCFTIDIINEFVFANPSNFLENSDLISPLSKALSGFCHGTHYYMYFPWLAGMMKIMPRALVYLMDPGLRPFMQMMDDTEAQVQAVIDSGKDLKSTESMDQPTIFHEILFKSSLPSHEKSAERLNNEALTLISAGIETTTWTLSLAMFHILNNPEILKKLKEEILTVWPQVDSPPNWSTLETLPYLTAVIQESLRLSYGAVIRLPRVSPHKPVFYREYVIPAGTPMSTSNYTMSHNETIFPDSHQFQPSRWIENSGKTINANGEEKQLSRYLATFSKGSRICLGMNLAYAELYIGLANIVRRVDLRLYETTIKDVECKADLFVPKPRAESKGIRVKVL